MTWTVLRLHRTALIVWGAFVALMIAVLVWNEVGTADAALRELDGCLRHSPCTIHAVIIYNERIGLVGTAVCYSFLAVAAFSGGALFGRELEYGTVRLAWTQSVTPGRWLAAKLAVPALALAVGGTALVLAFRWAWSAHPELLDSDWTSDHVFVARGPAMVAYSLCALAVGAVTALALRRTLPALGVSVAVMALVNQVMEYYRQEDLVKYWTPHLAETGILLALAATAALAAFALLHGRTD
ncbi:hypothetical protein FNH04_37785 [Streptomyces phyllanthi]|uniref:ABC transporter permease n=1 Tax=Streptomyces phyllanthi TaxID=1803180 RepID=A0A5N8WDA2_9ACTN|nr:hypothetical protein [Streptomyces phyllanthi]